MPVFKATITVTVMLEAEDEAYANNWLGWSSLERIGQQIDTGDWLGTVHIGEVVEIKGHNALTGAQEDMGNDGTFFNTEE